jgi:hypothetical protein
MSLRSRRGMIHPFLESFLLFLGRAVRCLPRSVTFLFLCTPRVVLHRAPQYFEASWYHFICHELALLADGDAYAAFVTAVIVTLRI